MTDSSDSVSIDMETPSPGGKEYLVKTSCGCVSVSVHGDQDKPALICPVFRDYSFVPKLVPCSSTTFAYTISVLQVMRSVLDRLSEYIDLLGAAAIGPDQPMLSADDLADQIVEVLNYFGLGAVMCMGVTAGAYILTLFAMKYRQRILGLILISPLCKAPSWSEWLYNKVMSNLLYYCGMCGVVKELLLKRYFSKEARGGAQVPESDIVQACRKLLDQRQSFNVWLFLETINRREDISEGLRKLNCRSLIFVGEHSPFHSDALHMTSKLDRRFSALIEVQACGSVVTEEQPHAMFMPMEYFLMGYGMSRPPKLSVSPRSPLGPVCISPDLLSPESMGLKLKPIKTRISMQV